MTVSASTTSSSSNLATESSRSLYEKLVALLKDISHVKGISSLLGWDQMVMMPKNAEDARANQVKKNTICLVYMSVLVRLPVGSFIIIFSPHEVILTYDNWLVR